jgi:hypothetical protein
VFELIAGLLVGSLYFLRVGLSMILPPIDIVGLFNVKVPPLAEPIPILVVEPEAPPVPRLTALVIPVVVAPVAKLYVDAPVEAVNILTVCAAVAVLPNAKVVAAPPMLKLVVLLLNNVDVSEDVVKSPPFNAISQIKFTFY